MLIFYSPDLNENAKTFIFNKQESKHIVTVLRKKEGNHLHITNGEGTLYKAQIKQANPNKCTVVIISKSLQEKPLYDLHLAVAPTKMKDRYEWFLEKATEIGVSTITPIICDHSERTVIKVERFSRILQSAMKQSLNFYLPKLNSPLKFNDFIKQDFKGQRFIAHCEKTNKTSLKNAIQPGIATTILIGPEGDFSTKEIDIALEKDFTPVSLGKTRLRTETAAIVASHTVAFVNE